MAEGEEKNAWQADALIDRILLGLMLAAIVLSPCSPRSRAPPAPNRRRASARPALAALFAAARGRRCVAYRIIQEPGLDAGDEREGGRAAGALALAMIALGSAYALRADDRRGAADAGAD